MTFQKYFLIIVILLALQVALAEPVVIVNIDNPVDQLSVLELRDYYFKRKRTWPHGENVRFMDRTKGYLRNSFLKNYIGKSSSDIELYWIGQKLYSGDSAPLKEATDATTMMFVASLKGAIGYVSDSTFLHKDVKVIKVETSGD